MQKLYDDEKTTDKPGQHDRLPMSDEVRQAETQGLEDAFNSPTTDEPDLQSAESSVEPNSQPDAGESAELDKLGAGYNPEGGGKKPKGILLNLAISRRNKLIGGTTIGGILLGLVMSAFIALPLKVQHIANNLQSQFYASVDQATQQMLEVLVQNYIADYLIPGMVQNNCTSTLTDKDCVNVKNRNNIVSVHMGAWSDARLEQKLAKQGIIISRDESGFTLTTKTSSVDLGNYDPNNPQAFKENFTRKVKRKDLKKEVKDAVNRETHWTRLLYRLQVSRLLANKYGITWCVVACDERRAFNSLKDDVKDDLFVYIFLQRVVTTHDEGYALAMECATRAFDCTGAIPIGPSDDPAKPPERRTKLEDDLRTRILVYANNVTNGNNDLTKDDVLAKLEQQSQDLKKNGMVEETVKKVLSQFGVGDKASNTITKKVIPVLGWVDIGLNLLLAAQEVGPAAVKFTAVINGAIYAQQWGLLRSNADEIKSGKVDLRATGSVATSLSASDGIKRTDQGGAGAEASPLYGAIMGSGQNSSTASLSTKAYAADNGPYSCEDNDNKPPPNRAVVCDVERLDTVSGGAEVLAKVSDVANSPLFALGGPVAEIWNKTYGLLGVLGEKILGPVTEAVIAALPGDPVAKLAAAAKPVVETVSTLLIKPVLTGNMSGARSFNIAAGGADLTGNYFAHYGLGAAKVTDQQAQAIRNEREQERYDEFKQRGMFARMFSTDSRYSLVSKAAMATPLTNSAGVPSSFFGVVSNPVGAFTSSFASMMSGSKAGAAASKLAADPFGITQYAYTDDNPVFQDDPEKYWVENDCDNPQKYVDWGNRAVDNPDTGMPEHTTGDTNGCMLLRAAIGSGSGIFTDEVLTESEKAYLAGGSQETVAGSGGDFRIATYNVRGASHTDGASDQRANKDWVDRMSQTIETIESQGLDIIGFQELQDRQYDLLKERMGGTFALTKKGTRHLTENAIGWDKAKYAQIGEEGTMPGLKYFNDSVLNVPWVKLKDRQTGQVFYVLNTHDPANANGCDCASERLNNAKQHVEFVSKLKTEGLPIFFTGDFNSGYEKSPVGKNGSTVNDSDENITYCIITKNNTMDDAYDLFKKRKVTCPNPLAPEDRKGAANGIDHIYVTNGVTVSKFGWLDGGYTKNGSDHPTIYADVTMPGSRNAVSGSVKMYDDYKTECRDYKDAAGEPDCDGQCVDFIQFRLKKHIDRNKFTAIGASAKDVPAELRKLGYKVDNTPALNSVAVWPAGGIAGSSANTVHGHVAMVSKVSPDGSITVEEYNAIIPAATYSTRTLSAQIAKGLEYVHTESDYK